MSISRPPTLPEYLIEQDFVPVAEGTWHDRDTVDGIIRVVHDPGEYTELIALTPAWACRYTAIFSLGTPDAVIIAAVQAALSLPPDAASQPPPRPLPGAGAATRDASRDRPQEGRPR